MTISPVDTATNCVIHGDALEELKKLPDHCVDAIVADPPAGIAMMQKQWDCDKGGRTHWIAWLAEIMTEARRVIKPGGHALIWALPRTSHWTATAIEDAGWNIRDIITHINGQGFPKSFDVSKAIDAHFKVEREIVGYTTLTGNAAYENGKRESLYHSMETGAYTTGEKEVPVTAPATEPAKRYAGFGTALKPAVEEWILARAPLAESTIAGNVLAWGTGAINVDATRIATSDDRSRPPGQHKANTYDLSYCRESSESHSLGRWPSNCLLSHAMDCTEEQCDTSCPVHLLDMQGGTRKSGGRIDRKGESLNNHGIYNPAKRTKDVVYEASEGTASRYFQQFRPDLDDVAPFYYAPKASRRERNLGCEALNASAVHRYGAGIGEGKDPDAPVIERNTHPTVKSLQLMRYMVRLVTPANGVVLDMFAGSGSTLVAALQCGFGYIGIEENAEYVAIARARIAHAEQQRTLIE